MVRATREDKSLVTAILKASFMNNQSVNYIVREGEHKERRILALMDYSFEMCFRFGEVWLSEEREAAALLLFPQRKRTIIQSIWLDIKLIFQAIGITNISRAIDREGRIKAKQPKEPMVYLWFIGVDPSAQHRGIGSKLLAEIVAAADAMHLPVFLETSTQKNLPWYERFNFCAYGQLEFGYTLFFLKRAR